MKTRTQLMGEITGFLREHEHVITNALQNQERHMREAAAEAQAGHDSIKDDPEACARQDQTMVTTNGLAHMARMFTEAADQARRTLDALDELAADLEDEDW